MTTRKKATPGEPPVASPPETPAEAQSSAAAAGDAAVAAEAASAPRPRVRRAPGTRRRAQAGAAAADTPEAGGAAAEGAPEAVAPPPAAPAAAAAPRRRAPRRKAVPEAAEAPAVESAGEPAAPVVASDAAPVAAPAPRRRAPRRKAVPEAAEAPAVESAGEPAASVVAPTGMPEGDRATAASGAEEVPAVRRRRGTRGGTQRSRARRTGQQGATAAPAEQLELPAEAPSSVAVEASPPAAPAPTVSAGDESSSDDGGSTTVTSAAGDEQQAAAKRRRRGHRGGRRRSKPGAAATAEADAGSLPEAPAAETAALAPSAETGAATPEEEPGSAWQRRLRARRAAAAGAALAPSAGEPPAAVTAAPEEGAGTAPSRRRRGSRGGRRGAAAAPAPEAAATTAEAAASQPEPAGAEAAPEQPAAEEGRSAGRRRGRGAAAQPGEAQPQAKARRKDVRRPKAIVRADEGEGAVQPREVPARRLGIVADQPERKFILVSDDGRELRVALVEDGRLAEIYIERPEKKSYLGDIYQGKVESVLNGIDAAFVDFGLEKNGFLYVDDVVNEEGERRARRISDALKQGQTVLVQVTKDPMGSKGARLSTKISLAGRYLVYVPGGSGIGVSRRLPQAERDRLRDISKELKAKSGGIIVRTLAEGHGHDDLKRDLQVLSRLWTRLKKKAEAVSAPGLVHREADVSLEVARDLFNDSVEKLIVDDAKRHKALLSYLTKVAPELAGRLELYQDEQPLFEAHGIEDQIARALERRVPLPSGGNLVIDHAEALTVIDVNSGRFTRGKGLEDTITKTNLEAAREAVRQLRLRDIGGIIIIDFIDMAHAHNRETVLETLEAELEMDRTKTYVVELSPLGLVEMTRQNTTDGARGILTRACPACSGKGRVLSEESMALSVERRLRTMARRSTAKAWLIEVNGGVAERLAGDRLKRLEKQTGRRIFFEGGSRLAVDAFRVVAEGALPDVQAQRIPVREGQEVEVELTSELSYSRRDAVGYVDGTTKGYRVVVEGGRAVLGQRRKVRITATSRAGGEGVLLKEC